MLVEALRKRQSPNSQARGGLMTEFELSHAPSLRRHGGFEN